MDPSIEQPFADRDAADPRSAEIEILKARLAEAEETLRAIRSGEVDALVVGNKIYVLEGIEAASNRFRGEVLAQIDDAVIAIDNEQRVTYFNAAAERLVDTAASEALGRPLGEICDPSWFHPQDPAGIAEPQGLARSWRGRDVVVKKDGRQVHVESIVTVMLDAEGGKTGLLSVVRDITERIDAEQQRMAQRLLTEQTLREADQRKDEFIATMAHELRNPLAPISNALLIMQRSDEPAVRENAQRIIGRQLQQLVHLVDDLLDISRITQGKVELRRRHVDIGAALQAAVETSRPLVDLHGHTLSVLMPAPGSLIAHADLTRLSQIITNMMNNAAKYTPPGGRIEVSAERDGPQAVISVRDSGLGIPAELLPRVFDMFAQIDRPLERDSGGLGIGLALVKRLVELHGGSVEAHSDGLGRGSRFVVRIPLVTAGAPDAPGSAPLNPSAAGAVAGRLVLVADDNVDSADSLSQALELLGYQTLTANDGLQAYRLAESERPSVVLLDIGMPKMSGHEIARRIREHAWGRQMLLIAISGWGQEDDLRRSMEAGFDRHVVKPIDIEQLSQLLAQQR